MEMSGVFKKKGCKMKKIVKISLMLSVLLLFALSLPNVYTKHQTETQNNVVEVAVDFKHIYFSTKRTTEDFKKEYYEALRNNGVTSIGLTENSLLGLEEREVLHIFKGIELSEKMWDEPLNFEINRNYTYVVIPNNELQDEIVETIKSSELAQTIVYRNNDTVLLELQAAYRNVFKKPILYLESDVEELSKHFYLVPRVSNLWADRLPIIKEQIQKIHKEKPFSSVVFAGAEAEGYSVDNMKIDEMWNGIGIGMLEVFDAKSAQKGSNDYAYASNFNVVRVHSIPRIKMETQSGDVLRRLVVKAANERNIRMFYVNPPFYDETKEEKDYIAGLEESLSAIYFGLDENGYTFGQAKKFTENETWVNKIGVITSILGAFLLFALAVYMWLGKSLFKEKMSLFYLFMASGLGVVIFGLMASKMMLLSQIASLGITILLPVWMTFVLMHGLGSVKTNEGEKMRWIILKLLGLFVVGITFLTAMNYSVEQITYIKGFKGVSLTLSVPIIIVGLYLLITMKRKVSISKVLFHKIRIVDVVLSLALFAIFAFYISRSGNGGELLPFEADMRNFLEDKFNVRPRTKEIFFAFPVMTIMALMWKEYRWVKWALPIATLGFASIFNTFTHFHTPLEVSLLRTVLSIGIGTFIGVFMSVIIMAMLEWKKTTSTKK